MYIYKKDCLRGGPPCMGVNIMITGGDGEGEGEGDEGRKTTMCE